MLDIYPCNCRNPIYQHGVCLKSKQNPLGIISLSASLSMATLSAPPLSFVISDMCVTLKGSEQSQIGAEFNRSAPVLPPTLNPNLEPQYRVVMKCLAPKLAPHVPV